MWCHQSEVICCQSVFYRVRGFKELPTVLIKEHFEDKREKLGLTTGCWAAFKRSITNTCHFSSTTWENHSHDFILQCWHSDKTQYKNKSCLANLMLSYLRASILFAKLAEKLTTVELTYFIVGLCQFFRSSYISQNVIKNTTIESIPFIVPKECVVGLKCFAVALSLYKWGMVWFFY